MHAKTESHVYIPKTVKNLTSDIKFTHPLRAAILTQIIFSEQLEIQKVKYSYDFVCTNMARLPYQYCSKNVSGYRCHPRSVVAYSAEVVHHAVPIR